MANLTQDNINIGKILYVLGTGSSGPINRPIYVEDFSTAQTIFGNGSLVESIETFFISGGTGAYLVRITGEYANININGYGTELVTNPVNASNNKITRKDNDLRNKINIGDKLLIGEEEITVSDIQFIIEKDPLNIYTEITIEETLINTYTNTQLHIVLNTALTLEAVRGEVEDNSIGIIYTSDSFIISSPKLLSYEDGIFYYQEYTTIKELVNEINKRLSYLVTASSIVDDFKTSELYIHNENAYLSANVTGLEAPSSYEGKFKNYLFDSLVSTLELLNGKYMDIICLAGMYFDDITPIAYDSKYAYGDSYYTEEKDYLDIIEVDGTPTGFHKIMIEFCKNQMDLGIFTHCIMGFNTLEDNINNIEITIAAEFDTIFKYNDSIQEYVGDMIIDNGQFISLCFGDVKYNNKVINWYMTYTALWLSAGYNVSLTAIKLPDSIEAIQEFNDNTLDNLINFSLVTYKYSAYYGWCITAGITKALDSNPLKFSINHKILQRVISQLNIDVLNHISNTETITNTTIGNTIDSSLKERRDTDEIIYDYGFTVNFDKLSGNTEINIDIYSNWSTEKISMSTTIYGR